MQKITNTEWLEWVGKTKWTYLEAVALSMDIHPENLLIKTHEVSGGANFDEAGSLDWEVITTYKISLTESALRLGKATQDKINYRVQMLMGIKTPKATALVSLPKNPNDIAGTPAKLIPLMLFEDWDLPKELKSIDVSNLIAHEKESQPEIVEIKELSAYEKRRSKARRSLDGNVPDQLSLSQVSEYLNVSRATLAKHKKESSFPKPSNDPQGNQKAYYEKTQIDKWWNNR